LRDTVRIGILAPLRSATTALAYFLSRIIHEGETRSWDSLHNVL
jgi:hypothetical protein